MPNEIVMAYIKLIFGIVLIFGIPVFIGVINANYKKEESEINTDEES